MTERTYSSETEIDLLAILRLLWRNVGYLLLAGLAGGVLLYLISAFLIPKTYQSGFSAYVNNRSETSQTQIIENSDTTAGKTLAATYAAIIVSRPVVELAIEDSGLGLTYEDVNSRIEAEVESDTALINISVTLSQPEDALRLAESMMEVSPSYLEAIVEGSSMKIVATPVLSEEPYSPHPARNAGIGAVLSVILAALLVIFLDVTDTRVKSESELEEKFGVRVIGTIPNFEEAGSRGEGYSNYYYYKKKAK